jgi:hypothetical protein
MRCITWHVSLVRYCVTVKHIILNTAVKILLHFNDSDSDVNKCNMTVKCFVLKE